MADIIILLETVVRRSLKGTVAIRPDARPPFHCTMVGCHPRRGVRSDERSSAYVSCRGWWWNLDHRARPEPLGQQPAPSSNALESAHVLQSPYRCDGGPIGPEVFR